MNASKALLTLGLGAALTWALLDFASGQETPPQDYTPSEVALSLLPRTVGFGDPLIARVEKVFVDDREIADVVSLDTKAGIVDEIIFDENDPSEWSPRRHYGKVKILWKTD